jgi:hypothetical protein
MNDIVSKPDSLATKADLLATTADLERAVEKLTLSLTIRLGGMLALGFIAIAVLEWICPGTR